MRKQPRQQNAERWFVVGDESLVRQRRQYVRASVTPPPREGFGLQKGV
jgi:hypothetical protein